MPRPLPTFAQIQAVQKVLYDHIVWRDIEGELESIDGTMDTHFAQENHITIECAHGVACTPVVDPIVGAKYADNVAQLLFKLGGDVGRVAHINGADKADLVTGVDELGKSWQARAKAWRAAASGDKDVKALLGAISAPFAKSVAAFARVQEYLK
jgi:hypothetical protein